MEPQTFTDLLYKDLEASGLTKQELANRIDRHPSHVSRLVHGHVRPTVEDVAALAMVFKWDAAKTSRVVHLIASEEK